MTDPDTMAEFFAQWAKREGILPIIDKGQCADLARAYMAGWVMAETWRETGCAADMEALKRLTERTTP
jgi:hypothetical protein